MDLKRRSKRELDEQRKKDEEEQTARVYREFEDSFSSNKRVIGTTFIKGGMVQEGKNPDASLSRSSSKRSSSPVYYMPAKLPEKVPPPSTSASPLRKHRDKPLSSATSKKDKERKSNLASFKEELEQLQQERQERKILKEKIKDIEKHTGTSLRMPDPSKLEVLLPDELEEYLSSTGKSGNISRRNISGNMENYIDSTDINSTNIYMGNLSPSMNEEKLVKIFGIYGPLASVKMFWPRGDDAEERMKMPLCGFVAYMCRADAENAMERLRQSEVLGYEMRVGWGKAVPTPNYPIAVPKKLIERLAPLPLNGMPFNAQPDTDEVRELFAKHKSILDEAATTTTALIPMPTQKIPLEDMQRMLKGSSVKVSVPVDRTVVAAIHRTIEFVVREGPSFEAMLMQRERNNTKFEFLFNFRSNEHAYYRWKLFSILMGDAPDAWHCEPFRMISDGPLWRPPPVDPFRTGMPAELIAEDAEFVCRIDSRTRSKYQTDSGRSRDDGERSSSRSRSNKMSHAFNDDDRKHFKSLLLQLTPERTSVATAMLFCIDHAESAEEICDTILQVMRTPISNQSTVHERLSNNNDAGGIKQQTTTIFRSIAILYLISDILHNSGSAAISSAWRFRKSFQTALLDVFRELGTLRQTIDARLKAEQFKERVLTCCRAWEQWVLYPVTFIIRLQNIFLGIEVAAVVTPSKIAAHDDDSRVSETVRNNNSSSKNAHKRASRWQPLSSGDETPLITSSQSVMETPMRKSISDDDDEDIDGTPVVAAVRNPTSPTKSNGLKSRTGTATLPHQSLLSAYHDASDDDDDDIDGVPLSMMPASNSMQLKSKIDLNVPDVSERKRRRSGDQNSSSVSPAFRHNDKFRKVNDNDDDSRVDGTNSGDSNDKRKSMSASGTNRSGGHSSNSSGNPTRSKWDED